MNLLKETLDVLEAHKLGPADVEWVGTSDWAVSWSEFTIASADLKYDEGFGAVAIAMDLVIVGKSWWLERSEYDTSERWEFKQKPEHPMTSAIVISASSLLEDH